MKENLLYIDSLIVKSYQNLNFAVFIKDRKSCYLWGNDFFVSQSAGFPSLTEIINKKDEDLPWRDYTDELTNNDKLLFESHTELTRFEKIQRHEGSIIDLVSKKLPLFDKKSELIGLLGFSFERPQTEKIKLLSQQEQRIVTLLSQGLSDKQMAKQLGLSPRTIETHINNAKRKLRVKTRAELIAKLASF